jgi:hypothetical protein
MPAKSSQKGRKIGRNKQKCEAYRKAGTREKNKARRIAREANRQARLDRRKKKLGTDSAT